MSGDKATVTPGDARFMALMAGLFADLLAHTVEWRDWAARSNEPRSPSLAVDAAEDLNATCERWRDRYYALLGGDTHHPNSWVEMTRALQDVITAAEAMCEGPFPHPLQMDDAQYNRLIDRRRKLRIALKVAGVG